MFSEKCSICFKVNDLLKEISQTDEDSLTFSSKLEFVVPEVDWISNYKVCEVCISEVRTSYRFKQQCLNLKNNLKEEHFEHIPECKLELDYDSDNNSHTQESEQHFMCYQCEYMAETKEELVEHIQQTHQNSNKELPCNKRDSDHLKVCDGVTRHKKVKNKIQCETCKRFYSTEKNLTAHLKRCNGTFIKKTDFQCQKCNVHYKSRSALTKHTNTGCKTEDNDLSDLRDSDTIEFQCEKCDKTFQNIVDRDAHKLEHKKTDACRKVLSCQVCNAEFKSLKEIVKHCLNEHSLQRKSVKPYCCDLCQKRFGVSTNLLNHKLYHEGERRHMCSICGKCFITKSDLLNHEITHSGTRKFGCDKCNTSFKTNSNLRTHYFMLHTDPMLWKFVCEMCGKRFPLKSDHDLHVRRHNGQKEFVCSLCKKPFASNRELQVHIRSHSDIKQFICEKCDKAYRTRNSLNIHLTRAHGIGNAKIPVREKKHVCNICPARFSDKVKLARHLCTHTGVKPFACFVCHKKFIDKSYMKHHIKIVHNIIDDPFHRMSNL